MGLSGLSGLSGLLGLVGGGGAPFPDEVEGLVLHLDAVDSPKWQDSARTTPVASDSDPVGAWDDLSGNGHHALAASDAVRPTYKENAINGLSALRFEGTDDELALGDLSASFPTAATLFAVATISSDDEWSLYRTANNGNRWRFSDGAGYIGIFRSVRLNLYPPSMPSTGTYVWSIRSSADGYRVYQNGVALGTEQAADFAAGTDHSIGIGTTGDALDGDIAEILIYDTALSDDGRQAVEAYLRAKWGVS